MVGRVGFRLRYEVITCLRCDARRERGRACPECGKKPDPREVNDALVTRRQLVATLRALIERNPSNPSKGADAQVLLEEASDLLPAVLSGLQGALEHGNADDAAPALARLRDWSDQVDGLDRWRPGIQRVDLLRNTRVNLWKVVEEILNALAADMSQAQHHGRLMQSAIDATESCAAEYVLLKERFEQVQGRTVVEVARSALELELKRTETSIAGYVLSTSDSLAQALDVNDPDLIATEVALFSGVGAFGFDMDNYQRSLRQAFQIFDHPDQLRGIVATSNDFLDDFIEARVSLNLLLWGTGQAVEQALSERAATEAIVSLMTSLVDRPGGFLARALLLTSGVKRTSYDKLRHSMATTDIERAQHESSLSSLVAFLDTRVRTAQAHDGVRYRAGRVSTSTRQHGFAEHEPGALLDRTLGAVETIHAALCALRLALARAGFTVDEAVVLEAMGTSSKDVALLGISLASGTELATDTEGEVLLVEASGSRSPNLLTLLAHQCLQLEPSITEIRITFTAPDGTTSHLEGPSEPLRSWQPQQPDALGILESLCEYKLDGTHVLGVTTVRYLAGLTATQALQTARDFPSAYKTWGTPLKRLRRVSEKIGDDELLRIVKDCQKGIRTGRTDSRVVSGLQDWLSTSALLLP